MLKILCAVAALVLAGCVQTVAIDVPFSEAEHAYAIAAGRSTVSGQAFMRRNDGIVVYAAGSPVLLLPRTAYTNEIYRKATSATFGVNFTNMDQRLAKYSRKTTANGEGRFSFAGIPNGSYFVMTEVRLMAGDKPQGGDLVHIADVNGQNVDVIMSR